MTHYILYNILLEYKMKASDYQKIYLNEILF